MTIDPIIAENGSGRIAAVRGGLPYASFASLRDALDVDTEELTRLLGIPRRTLTKRKRDGAFTPSESNSISRVARVYREAAAFFDDVDDAVRWLKTPLPALESRPLDLLDTDPGAEEVSTLLRQLAWGIYP